MIARERPLLICSIIPYDYNLSSFLSIIGEDQQGRAGPFFNSLVTLRVRSSKNLKYPS